MKFPNATAQMNKTPDTMKMDLGQNILEKSLLIFSEAKASAHSYLQNCIKPQKIPTHFHLHSSFF